MLLPEHSGTCSSIRTALWRRKRRTARSIFVLFPVAGVGSSRTLAQLCLFVVVDIILKL